MKATPAEPETLSGLMPFDRCTEDELIVLADHAWVMQVPGGQVLAQAGSSDEWDYYLLDGELELVSEDGKSFSIRAGSEAARHPVAHLQPRKFTIRAQTPATCLRVQKALMSSLSYGAETGTGLLLDEPETGGLIEHPLFVEIEDDLANERLVLPSLPELALKIRQLVDREDASVVQVVRLVQTDPAICARLVKIANGALYHGMRPVESLQQAVARLGLNTTRNLVVGFVLRNLFCERIRNPELRRHAAGLWEHSVEVGVIAQVLARTTPGMAPEEALLVGLLHDIGELVILSYAENSREHVEDAAALAAVIDELRGRLGGLILREWNFPAAFVTACEEAESWRRDPGPEPDYCDLIIVAQLHAFIGTQRMKTLPAIAEVPAFGKVAGGGLTPEEGLRLLDQARQQVAEVKRLLLA